MHTVVGQEPQFRTSILINETAVDIKIFHSVFPRYRREMAVDRPDGIVLDPGHVNRQKALDNDHGTLVPGRQVPHELCIRPRDIVLLRQDVVDAGHEEDDVRRLNAGPDMVAPVEQFLDGLARDAEVQDTVGREPLLPVVPFGQ